MTNFINAQQWVTAYKRLWRIAFEQNQPGKMYTLIYQIRYLRGLNPNLDLRIADNRLEVTRQLERIKQSTARR